MVRETRHLWVGNLPENIREDRIREHFKRYGRVQSVKLLPRVKDDDGSSGLCATVAFMDIKSASKAHNMEHKLEERCLSTEYYEPAAIPGGSAAPHYVAPRFPHGPPEDHATFERSSHFYERREGDAYLRRPAAGYHVTDPLRGRARERLYRNGPYTPLIERTQPTHHRALANAWSYDGTPSVRYPPAVPVPDPYPEERREVQPVAHKKRPKSSRSGSESGSNSGSSRSRSRSRSHSHSSSSSSQSGSSSCSSATSSPGTDKSCSPHSSHHGTVRSGRVALQSTVSAPHTNNVSPAVHSEDRRPLAICVRNLPIRSSDTSLKDGLFHEYKKHGKVVSVKVVGQAGDRYAIVCFKKPEDAEKALEESQDKLFFGCKIEVAPYQGYDVDDNEFRPYEAEQDEYHPKATRTLFIGNLEKDITASELRKHFEQFGEIIEIDIKKQGVLSSYAFCQFADISSVVKAMRTMDGEHLGNNRIKLGFGKSMPTNCVWVDGIAENVPEKYLNVQFHTFGTISHVTVDRDRGHALIYFEQVACAQEAVREMRGFMLRGRKLQVDFASRECQEAFYEHLEKQGHAVVGGERPWDRYDTNCSTREVQAGRFETTVVVPGGARFTRYDAPQRPRAASYNRNSNSSVSTPVAAGGAATTTQGRSSVRAQRVGQRYEYYDSEYPDRRYRNYDEFSQGSGASHDDSYEQELRDYGYCQRERGDSSPSPITCESEGMRRSVAVVARPVRSEKSSSPCEKVEEEAFKRHALQSVVVSDVGGTAPLQQVPPPLPPPPSLPQHPPDIRHLQKERVHIQHLLEQLDDCTSSGDDDTSVPNLVPKKRIKLTSDECAVNSTGLCASAVDGCFENMNHGDVGNATSLLVTTHNHRKSLSEVRRMSDTGGKHCSRRLSTDSLSKHGSGSRDVRETSADRLVSVQVYSPHPVCKRRKTGSSASESEDRASCRSGKHSHHHHHHHNDVGSGITAISGSESVDGSRPGTPLCDERPENLLPPSEPRRIPRERTTTEGPLSLPLPRFAAQVLSASPRLSVSISGTPNKPVPSTSIVASPPSVVTSPRPVSHPQPPLHPPPSPSPAPPPASPPPRPSSLSSSSSDSEISPPSPTLEERIRSLDEKYEKWSGSRAISAAGGDALAKLDASAGDRFRFRHKLLDLDLTELQPSDIVKSVLAKRSVFDEDSKRLENFSDKYEPREFIPYTRTSGCFQSLRVKTECAVPQCGTLTKSTMSLSPMNTPTTPVVGKLGSFATPTATSQLPPRLMGTPSPLHSPSQTHPKSPFAGGTPITPSPAIKPLIPLSPVGVSPLLPQCSKLQTMPKTSSTVSPRSAGSGLPAAKGLQYPFPSHPPVLPTTTVATTTATNAIGLVSVSSAGVKPSLSVTVPTTATATVLSPEVSRTTVVHSLEVSRPSVVRTVSSVTVMTTATCTKPSPEVTGRISLKLVSSASPVTGRVPSPGVLRLSFAKPPVTTVTTAVVVGSVISPEVLRSPTLGTKCSSTVISSPETLKVPVTTQGTARVSSGMSLPQVTSRIGTSVISSPRASTTSTVKLSTCSTSMSTSTASSVKVTKPTEHPAKMSSTVLMRAEVSRPGNNIPTMKSPSYTSSSESSPVPTSSSRVVIIPVSSSPTVTTVAAASTVTTTVVTVTMASTSITSTTFTTSATAVTTNSVVESSKHGGKPKTCITSKKEPSQSTSSSKDKQCESSSNKSSSALKKETLSSSTISGSPTKKDASSRDSDSARISSNHKSKSVTIAEEWRERKENVGVLCSRRDSERTESCEDKRRESADGVDRKKEREVGECAERDRRKDSHSLEGERRRDGADNPEKERRKDKEVPDGSERERRKEKETAENMDRRKEIPDFEEKERWKESHIGENDKDRWKDREDIQEKERRKDNNLAEGHKDLDVEKERRKERRKDRTSSGSSPASIGCKRRMSSQDSLESVPDDAKRMKLSPAVSIEHRKVPERRDSKDSGRSSSSSKRSSGERSRHSDKSFTKLLEDKIREERKQGKDELDRRREKETKSLDGFERYKIKDKQKKKNKADRDSPKDQRELPPKVPNDKDFFPRSIKKKEDSEPEERDEKHRHMKKEMKEKKKLIKEEFGSVDSLEEKLKCSKKDREKRNSSERRKEENSVKEESKSGIQKPKMQKKEFSHSDTDSEDGSCDGPKKHSIFDIVDDQPAYISMYDKVKARSTKNMQKQEEEKRQEKMREKFNLLKQSRAKREEKKRSTSWDEDSDSDNPDRERGSKASKRLAKLMISSSSEDDGRSHSVYDGEEMKLGKSRPIVRIKKEDMCLGDSDSDAQQRIGVTEEGLEDAEGSARTSTVRKGSRSKLVSDTSEDDISTISRFKTNAHKSQDIYSADSEVDLDYADSDDKHCSLKKPNGKNSKVNKSILELSNDEGSPKKILPDISKVGLEKQAVLKKITAKNKIVESSDDEAVKKLPCDPVKTDMFGDDKQAIFRKSIAKNKTCKMLLDSSDDDNARKLLAESVKMNAFNDDKQMNFKKFSTKNKMKTCLDSSDDDIARKTLADTLKNEMYEDIIQSDFKKTFVKNKTVKVFPEDTSKTFSLHAEKNDLFNEVKVSVPNKVESSIENISDVEGNASTPPQLEKVLFYSNSVGKSSDSSRKKSHKKKQKRQKILQSGEESVSKILELDSEAFDKLQGDDCMGTEDAKLKGDGERKRHKRERRKSTYSKSSDGDGKQSKPRKKKIGKPELGVLKTESNLKREEKMEDIFGPLSDDSEPGHVKSSPPPPHNSGRMFDKMSADKWQVSLVYGSDSDSNIDPSLLNSSRDCFSPTDTVHARSSDKERKRREKKRRERKAREEDCLAVDLAEAGRAIEAKLLDDDYLDDADHKSSTVKDDIPSTKQENDADVFRFTDGDESLETTVAVHVEKTKEKKKKRKKSKEEKQSRREHHHHHHHDKSSSKCSPERRLPSLDMPPVLPQSPRPIIQCRESIISTTSKIPPITSKSNEKKKPDKFIPGFGSEIDDTIHETAVKSISEFEAPKSEAILGVKTEEPGKPEELLPKADGEGLAVDEEKPRAVISQEETEDAVKALLGESFGRGFGDCYTGEGNAPGTNPAESQLPTDEEDETRKAVEGLIDMKPDTPQSEHELQIDTDTDDNVDDSYPGLQYGGASGSNEEQAPRAPDVEFAGPPKTPDIPPTYYGHHHVKAYEPPVALTKPEVVLPPVQEEPTSKDEDMKSETVETLVKEEEHVDKEEEHVESAFSPVQTVVPEPAVVTEPKVEPHVDIKESVKQESEQMVEKEVPESEAIKEEIQSASDDAEKALPSSPLPVSVEPASPPPIHIKEEAVEETEMTQSEESPVVEETVIKQEMESESKQQSDKEEGEINDVLQEEQTPILLPDTNTDIEDKLSPSEVNMSVDVQEEKPESTFLCLTKDEPLCDTRESEFSEPEPDMRTDNDFVRNLLASETMNRELSDDNSRPMFGANSESRFELFKEHEKESLSVIKETEVHQQRLEEDRDPSSLPLPKPEAEPCTKEEDEFMRDPIKMDTDYWSAKEVNIDSVIKTVDALCSVEEMSTNEERTKIVDNENKLWLNPLKEKEVGPLVETKPEPEVPKPVPEEESIQKESSKLEEDKDEVSSSTEHEPCIAPSLNPEDRDNHRITSASSPDDRDHLALSTSSPEGLELDRESQCHSTATPKTSRRGRRGTGGRRKVATTRGVLGVTTRRTRLASGQKHTSELSVSIPVSPRRGGRAARGAKVSHESLSQINKKPADVYEFHDDSEDESSNSGEKGRPRLILTIKSPVSTSTLNSNLGKDSHNSLKPPPSPITSPIVETREEFPPPPTSTLTVGTTITSTATSSTTTTTTTTTTRKSRRLQERDGSRSTVDDVIEDVVRGTIVTRSAAAAAAATGVAVSPRRSTRQNNAGQRPSITFIEPRKSPRGGRKAHIPGRIHDELSDEKKKDDEPLPLKQVPETSASPPAADTPGKDVLPEKSVASLPLGSATVRAPCIPSPSKESVEPMTLIDPVTGLLIPMRESEEGQYIPVTTANVDVNAAPPTTSTASVTPSTLTAADKTAVRAVSIPPTIKTVQSVRPGTDGVTSSTLWTSGVPQKSHVPVISTPAAASTTVPPVRPAGICKPGALTSPLPAGICKPGALTSPLPAKPTAAVLTSSRPVTTLKAHVLQQASKTLPVQQPAVVSVQSIKPISTVPSVVTTTTTVQKPLALSTNKGTATSMPMTPKAHLLQAVASNKVVTSQVQPLSMTKVPQQQAGVVNMKAVSAATPLNPKTHILQAAAKTAGPAFASLQMPSSGKGPRPSSPAMQKAHAALLAVTGNKASAPSPPLPQPPKAHHGLAQQPILTGAVASPPLKAPHHGSQQPIVTGASSSRVNVPKPQVPGVPSTLLVPLSKGLMDPPKVEVSMGGCIVVPTASPQQRGQVMQAGLPVPAYEASLGDVVQHVGFSHNMRVSTHELAGHYVHPQLVYQQYLRAQQEALGAHIPPYHLPGAVRSPMVPAIDLKSEADSEEVRASSPPLELRRPASGGSSLVARSGGGMTPHSLQSPHDRATDSPQVATVYVHGARLPHYTPQQQARYYEPGAEPPPAHLRSARHHHPMPGTEAPANQPRLQVATPPHASQVPPQADSLLMLLQRYPVMWQGLLALKNDQAAVQMHFVFGNPHVARDSLPCNSDGSTPPLRIAQRMRLEQTQVDGVARKMQMDNEHCMLLALPCGRDHMDVLQQSNNLQTGFITYLQQKQAAGIVNIAAPGSQQAAYVVHIFPSCDFANENLARIAPDLLHRVADIAHLLIIIATV